ncbi:ATP-dependent RNA helicase vasa-like isoform X2 [Choristoneura fumiferana]|uniref:ATP-dependent RNA helicase vasa-like isoform X2 n=1 Tax=Choristoneura fumiferana TaxID=7141 RepID=UPI003D1543F0
MPIVRMSRFYGDMETVALASTSKEALPNICGDVDQSFKEVNKFEKTMTLIKLIQENDGKRILVFVTTKRTADFVADVLFEQLQKITASLHEDRKHRHRKLARQSFMNGHCDILVATTGAICGPAGKRACGSPDDITDVDIVVNYDLPTSIDEYVHRIGRTGRIGHRGKVISFFDVTQDRDIVADLAKFLWQADQPLPDFFQGESTSIYSAPNLPQPSEESNDWQMPETSAYDGCLSVWLPYCCECSNYETHIAATDSDRCYEASS